MTLFDSTTLARRTDPAPSHEAARAIAPQLGRLQRETLAAIERWPDRTALELSELMEHKDPRRLNRCLLPSTD